MDKIRAFTLAGRMLKNLFRRPATTQYPFEPADYPERMRGHVRIEIGDCISCGLCMRSCPSGAILVDRKAGTWTIDRFDCVQCGSCVTEEMSVHGERLYRAGRCKKERDLCKAAGRAGGKDKKDWLKCRKKVTAIFLSVIFRNMAHFMLVFMHIFSWKTVIIYDRIETF